MTEAKYERLWLSQPPRASGEVETWRRRLVAWLDQQDRKREPLRPVVEKVINNTTTLLNANVSCTHSLEQKVFSATTPNVNWIIVGAKHSGLGAIPATSVSVIYVDGVVGRNTIELRFYAAGLTVNLANPLTVWLYFFPRVELLDQ